MEKKVYAKKNTVIIIVGLFFGVFCMMQGFIFKSNSAFLVDIVYLIVGLIFIYYSLIVLLDKWSISFMKEEIVFIKGFRIKRIKRQNIKKIELAKNFGNNYIYIYSLRNKTNNRKLFNDFGLWLLVDKKDIEKIEEWIKIGA